MDLASIAAGAVAGGIFGLIGQLAGTRVEMRGLADARDTRARERRTELAEQAITAAGETIASLDGAATLLMSSTHHEEAFAQLGHANEQRWKLRTAVTGLRLFFGPTSRTVQIGDGLFREAGQIFGNLSAVQRHILSGETGGWPEWVTAPHLAALDRVEHLPEMLDQLAAAALDELDGSASRR